MKTLVSLSVLIAIYVSLVFKKGILYPYLQLGLDWLSVGQGYQGYIRWALPLFIVAVFLFKLESHDKNKEEELQRQLIEQILLTGVTAEKIDNTVYGNIRLSASIIFHSPGFVLQIKQNENSENEVLLVSRKFMTWTELNKYINLETRFNIYDFMRLQAGTN